MSSRVPMEQLTQLRMDISFVSPGGSQVQDTGVCRWVNVGWKLNFFLMVSFLLNKKQGHQMTVMGRDVEILRREANV